MTDEIKTNISEEKLEGKEIPKDKKVLKLSEGTVTLVRPTVGIRNEAMINSEEAIVRNGIAYNVQSKSKYYIELVSKCIKVKESYFKKDIHIKAQLNDLRISDYDRILEEVRKFEEEEDEIRESMQGE